jgi:hypothetical protein
MRNDMTEDLELEAIGAVTSALTKLPDEKARVRVLDYANARFGVVDQEPPKAQRVLQVAQQAVGGPQRPRVETSEQNFPAFVDLFDKANPATNVDKALVAGYWLQCCIKQASWTGQQANNLLKDVGHPVGNITTATNNAQKQRPALVRQISKTGKAQQGRKTYKLTTAGVARVRGMLGLSEVVPPALADNAEEQGE